jgi:N-acetylneuraminate synthase
MEPIRSCRKRDRFCFNVGNTSTNEKNLKVFLIAEIGVNHNGSLDLAKEMVVAAKNSGADAVKFQTFKAERLAVQSTPKVSYQTSTTDAAESHLSMLKKLEFSEADHQSIFGFCQEIGIEFISTPYDIESVDFLETLGVARYKLASADIVDYPLQKRIAGTGKPLLLSTGMATLGEIERALECLNPLKDCTTLLHCVSNYPCSDESLNLRVISTLRQAFGLPVGYSDHSIGYEAATLSIAMGVKVIEKHFTTDKNLPGPDHAASSTPDEFSQLSTAVRRAAQMLGNPFKKCQPEESQMARVSRKSITLLRDVAAGSQLSESDLCMMRPGLGITPFELNEVIGKTTRHSLNAHHQLKWSDIE